MLTLIFDINTALDEIKPYKDDVFTPIALMLTDLSCKMLLLFICQNQSWCTVSNF
uniref:Uncharacterized protein n=1 Tax=Arundo donax TaxID=35708 RepID=A0A0A9DSM7_ARUDO